MEVANGSPFSACATFQNVGHGILLLKEISLANILEQTAFLLPTTNRRQVFRARFLRTDETKLYNDYSCQMGGTSCQDHVDVEFAWRSLDAISNMLDKARRRLAIEGT
jgi:hypothetical protein